MRIRFRLFTILIFAAALLLSVRIGGLWDDLSVGVGAVSVAEVKAAEKGKGKGKVTGKPKDSVRVRGPAGAKPKGSGTTGSKTKGPPKDKAGARPDGKDKAGARPDGKAEHAAGDAPAAPRRRPPAGDINDYDLGLLQDLAKRRRQLDKRERAIAMREGMLKAVEKRVEQKIAELKGIQIAIKRDLTSVQRKRGERFAKLIKIYSSMKPKDAARMFDELDLPIVIDLLGGMKEAASAPIIAAMNPKKVREITTGLAKRAEAKAGK